MMQCVCVCVQVHRDRHAPTVSYSHPMPDIDSLMQVWPTELEEYFANVCVCAC